MKRLITIAFASVVCIAASAQLKPRPDAFPPEPEPEGRKAVSMATTVAQMASWDRYPTYPVYVEMMQRWAAGYPDLCRLDTIGTSLRGRLILCLEITANPTDTTLPEFFYSSTIHGDEVTGYVMMLRLIDTLLSGYGTNRQYTDLVGSTRICINPLANPDGTYARNNNTVQGAMRYNANYVDLNRNYPDPFGSAKASLQRENEAMIAYVNRHKFRVSANLHGGSEVMNYPWDSFTSLQRPHPESQWWKEVCKRFVDTSRVYSPSHFTDVNSQGYVAGGDWYVIGGGRQDYMNYYHNCLELTMEVSTDKTIGSERLPDYWRFLQHPLVNYIAEVHHAPNLPHAAIRRQGGSPLRIATGAHSLTVLSLPDGVAVGLYSLDGRLVAEGRSAANRCTMPTHGLPAGIYMVRAGTLTAKAAIVR